MQSLSSAGRCASLPSRLYGRLSRHTLVPLGSAANSNHPTSVLGNYRSLITADLTALSRGNGRTAEALSSSSFISLGSSRKLYRTYILSAWTEVVDRLPPSTQHLFTLSPQHPPSLPVDSGSRPPIPRQFIPIARHPYRLAQPSTILLLPGGMYKALLKGVVLNPFR
jgi:hypothetical protein